MGRVTAAVKVENVRDLYEVEKGRLDPGEVRGVEVPDALVDTGATTFAMPKSLIEKLELVPYRTRQVVTGAGPATLRMFGGARLTIQGRDCTCDIMELPDGSPVLIGQIPLEALDFVVDPQGRRLIGNPAHGGEWVMELY